MDITDEILQHHKIYGSSDFTAQFATASSKALNYADGASIQKPETMMVTTIPRQITYKDTVGLFGSENHFVRVDLDIQNPVSACYEEPGWECSRMSIESVDPNDPYTYANQGYDTPGQAHIDQLADKTIVNTFEPARFVGNSAFGLTSSVVKVDLNNLKTGNKYIDCWLDVRLYNKAREEHPYDIMYVAPNSYFYVGFHARNTKRLPYNVSCVIGQNSPGTNDGLVDRSNIEDDRYLDIN